MAYFEHISEFSIFLNLSKIRHEWKILILIKKKFLGSLNFVKNFTWIFI